ncbi:LPXTG cell wall anchor domain-containing protein, partial [Nocardioides sp. IC4_145]|nr:LPXTG cell wall anchor domain-containing protein [Nocardioides sp. IC4_145]
MTTEPLTPEPLTDPDPDIVPSTDPATNPVPTPDA